MDFCVCAKLIQSWGREDLGIWRKPCPDFGYILPLNFQVNSLPVHEPLWRKGRQRMVLIWLGDPRGHGSSPKAGASQWCLSYGQLLAGLLMKCTEVVNDLCHRFDDPAVVFFSDSPESYYTQQSCPSEMKEVKRLLQTIKH